MHNDVQIKTRKMIKELIYKAVLKCEVQHFYLVLILVYYL